MTTAIIVVEWVGLAQTLSVRRKRSLHSEGGSRACLIGRIGSRERIDEGGLRLHNVISQMFQWTRRLSYPVFILRHVLVIVGLEEIV